MCNVAMVVQYLYAVKLVRQAVTLKKQAKLKTMKTKRKMRKKKRKGVVKGKLMHLKDDIWRRGGGGIGNKKGEILE